MPLVQWMPEQEECSMGPRPWAMVTGAASGIGQAAARRLLDEGCSVIAVDINEAGLERIASEGAEPLVADLADLGDRARVVESGQGIDYLVNAAGIIRLKALSDFTVDDWRDIFTINAEAIFFLCQGIGPTMQPGGAIVNLSSSSAKLANTVEAAVLRGIEDDHPVHHPVLRIRSGEDPGARQRRVPGHHRHPHAGRGPGAGGADPGHDRGGADHRPERLRAAREARIPGGVGGVDMVPARREARLHDRPGGQLRRGLRDMVTVLRPHAGLSVGT